MTQYLGTAALVASAAMVVVLAIQSHNLKQRNQDLIRRFTEPHPGLLVPSFQAHTLDGDTVTVGESSTDDRQVLFFFSSTCAYCLKSLGAVAALDSMLTTQTNPRARVYAIAVDSAASARRLVDQIGLRVPVVPLPVHRLALLYRVRVVPQLFVLDSGGRTVYARGGELDRGPGLDSVIAAVRLKAPARQIQLQAAARP
ncbi:MAG: peroxiredoxin family protein [Gemmatimonadaceae bacterium]